MSRFVLPLLTGLVVAAAARAQAPAAKFVWQKGQVLVYKVEHTSTVIDTVGGTKAEARTKLNVTKRWQVLEVDNAGVGTLQLSLTALRNETTSPDGKVTLYDSIEPEKSTEEVAKVMAEFVNRPLAVIRIDPCGRVLEVKESKQGGLSRFEATPPFVVVVPQQPVKEGHFWERDYNITLDPPQGTGEKFAASQRYVCKQSTKAGVVLQITTTLKKEPEAPGDRIPLLQWLPEGEVVFDPQTGIMQSAKLKIDKEVKGHQGDDSSYRLQSTYVEEYVGAK